MKNYIPLNDEQRRFAAENHNLIYAFLTEKELPEDDFYDVVVFGYLQAVYEYTTMPRLRRYAFATIAWRNMESHLKNHYKALSRQYPSVSLYAPRDASGLTWEDSLPDPTDYIHQLEMELLLHDLAACLPKRQIKALRLKASGYGIREIAKRQRTTIRTIRGILDDTYDVVVSICRR